MSDLFNQHEGGYGWKPGMAQQGGMRGWVPFPTSEICCSLCSFYNITRNVETILYRSRDTQAQEKKCTAVLKRRLQRLRVIEEEIITGRQKLI